MPSPHDILRAALDWRLFVCCYVSVREVSQSLTSIRPHLFARGKRNIDAHILPQSLSFAPHPPLPIPLVSSIDLHSTRPASIKTLLKFTNMIITRTLLLALRLAQFLASTILLSLVSPFLHQRNKFSSDSAFNRLIYALVVAVLSLVLSLAFMLPTNTAKHGIVHVGVDLLVAAALFAVFGLLQDWYSDGMGCKGGWEWDRKSPPRHLVQLCNSGLVRVTDD